MGVAMKIWSMLSQLLGVKPLISAPINGAVKLMVERYFIHITEKQIPPLPMMVLACHLGGARVSQGRKSGVGQDYIPSQSGLLPAQTASEWMFAGAVDIALFYFVDVQSSWAHRLNELMSDAREFTYFSDALTNALALQIVDELALGAKADSDYVERLSALLVEQCCRSIEHPHSQKIRPQALQLGRIEVAIDWIKNNLAQSISTQQLAHVVGVSESHLRRIFNDAMNISPHRYILHCRLERARELLIATNLSIQRIASECGFSSQSHMTACFNSAYGVTPAKIKQLAKKRN